MSCRSRVAVRGVLLGTVLVFGGGMAQATTPASAPSAEELALLKAKLVAQQNLLESQLHQLREQQSQIDELERRLGSTVSAPIAAAEAAMNVEPAQAAIAVAEPAAMPPPLVTTRYDGVSVVIGGSLRTTVNTTSARMLPDAAPFLVLPSVPGVREGTTKIDARLSTLLIAIRGRELGGFQLGGVIQAQLFDGDLLSGKYGVYPGVAYVEAVNDRWRFAAGLQPDVFSPKIPRMVDSMSGMAGSGNPGNSMKPQLRAERFINTDTGKWTFQGALADAQPSNIQPPSLASTENTGQPNYEARISFSRGTADSEASLVPYPQWEVGLSGANGSFRSFSLSNAFPAYDTNLSGIAIEGAVRIGQRLGLQGELYRGRAFAPYLGGIFQTVTTDRAAVRSQGGWAEIAWWWRPTLHTHFGYGRDRAWSKDGVQPEVRSNETTFANLFWDPSPMTTLGLEATWRRTVYEGDIYNEGLALMLSSELRF
jgi:hypothetical protein